MGGNLRDWLSELGLVQYAEVFAENDIDIDLVAELSDADLRDLGIASMGHRKKLLRAIQILRSSTDPDPSRPPRAARAHTFSATRAERRQLTVVFTDLVGSTALSQALDPEDLRELLSSYRDAIGNVAARYEGFVAKFLGDGVLIYFGWPEAHEDQAERAIRTALDAVNTVAAISTKDAVALQARAGVATGKVVVGELAGEMAREADAIVGDTPNLAARLQGEADAGQVVIDLMTRRLIAETFELDELGERILKGFSQPVAMWRVIAPRYFESRFEATHQVALTGFVGRQRELATMHKQWELAKAGRGQVVLLSGEAGIGKSRLVQAFQHHLADVGHATWRYQCSPSHRNSALFPVVQQLQRAAKFEDGDSSHVCLDKLETLVGRRDRESLALLADLLSLPFEARYGSLEMAPQQRKMGTIRALTGIVLADPASRPILLILEDAHWIDPTTEELIEALTAGIAEFPVMVIITHRLEWRPSWTDQLGHVAALELGRLGDVAVLEIVRTVGGAALEAELAAQIAERADGNPLYLEEITKATIEAVTRDGQAEALVPESLQSSLLARLDRLGAAKEIAQVGSVIGREFDHELLASVMTDSATELSQGLRSLIDSGLVLQSASADNAVYTFKHALVQDAAYGSLLRSSRRRIHASIASALESNFPDRISANPELIAHHQTQAERFDAAIDAWLRAGNRAAARSSNVESIAHYRHGLDLLDHIPDGTQRARWELVLRAGLGVPLSATRGPGDRETLDNYERARLLCLKFDRPPQLYQVIWGCWRSNLAIARLDQASALAGELLQFAQHQDDKGLLLEAHHAQWTTYSRIHEPLRCWDHAKQGISLYEPARHHRHVYTISDHDAGVCCRGFGALCLWQLGFPDQALDLSGEAVALARQLGHPTSLAHALTHSTWLFQLRRDLQPILARAEEIEAFASGHGFPQYTATANIFRGWALVRRGDTKEGIRHMRDAYETGQAKGTGPSNAYFLHLMADAYLHFGDSRAGLALIDSAIAEINRVGTNALEPEYYRVRGELLRMEGGAEIDVAEACLHKAKDAAREKGARSLELRAATSLGRLYLDTGRPEAVDPLLGPICDSFSEGFGAPDLRDAQALLSTSA